MAFRSEDKLVNHSSVPARSRDLKDSQSIALDHSNVGSEQSIGLFGLVANAKCLGSRSFHMTPHDVHSAPRQVSQIDDSLRDLPKGPAEASISSLELGTTDARASDQAGESRPAARRGSARRPRSTTRAGARRADRPRPTRSEPGCRRRQHWARPRASRRGGIPRADSRGPARARAVDGCAAPSPRSDRPAARGAPAP